MRTDVSRILENPSDLLQAKLSLFRSWVSYCLNWYSRHSNSSRCACDIPSHIYTWSFEPKADWSAVYASSKEIYQYFNDFSQKYGLQKYCHLKHQVTGARWDEAQAEWHVEVTQLDTGDKFTDICDILINASGILNAWRYPAIPGIEMYKGILLHTANWDEAVDLENKHVGLIGNG